MLSCESYGLDMSHDFISIISSFSFIIVGIIGLIRDFPINIKIIFALLFVNGFISAIWHYFINNLDWYKIDATFAMLSVLLLYIPLIEIFTEIYKEYFKEYYGIVISLSLIIGCIFFTIGFTNLYFNFMSFYSFNISFALTSIFLILFYFLLIIKYLDCFIQNRKVLIYCFIGIILILISQIAQLGAIGFCNSQTKFIPLHSFWHLGLSFSTYYVCFFIISLKNYQNDINFEINNSGFLNKIFPLIELIEDDEIHL